MQEANWNAVVTYVEEKMQKNRMKNGKYAKANEALWLLKKEMQEADSTITNVGRTFQEHENADYDVVNGEGK